MLHFLTKMDMTSLATDITMPRLQDTMKCGWHVNKNTVIFNQNEDQENYKENGRDGRFPYNFPGQSGQSYTMWHIGQGT